MTKHDSVSAVINAMHSWEYPFKNNNNDPDSIEKKYIALYLLHSDILPTRNITILYSNNIVGFGFYDICQQYETAIFHSLKVDYTYNHIFDFGIHATASRLHASGIKYMNIEEHVGIEGLIYKKDRLQPVKILRRYSALPIKV
jgi:hypothetical protein